MALTAMAVVPAMAVTVDGYEVEMYGYRNGVYTLSSHTDDMIDSVSFDGNQYTVYFVPAKVYGITGSITEITATATGETSTLEDTTTVFTFTPQEEEFTTSTGTTKTGTFISYQIALGNGGTHSSSNGAIVISPAE